MQSKELANKFNEEILRLSGFKSDEATVKANSVYLRVAADKFIYSDTSEEIQRSITNRAKSSRMAVPPSLQNVIDIDSVKQQTIIFLEKSKDCSTIDDLEILLEKKSTIEAHDGFDKLLSAFLNVPKG